MSDKREKLLHCMDIPNQNVSVSILRLYMYVKEDSLFSILKEKRLRLSRPWKTNDATEGVFAGDIGLDREIQSYCYLCFSVDCETPALWGHYSGGSTGACLVFDFPVIIVRPNEFIITKSGYVNTQKYFIIRKINYNKNRAKRTDVIKALTTKDQKWRFENEYRIILKIDKSIDIELNKDNENELLYYTNEFFEYINGIILGVKSTYIEQEIKSIFSYYSNKSIQVVKAKMSNNKFAYDIREISYNSDWNIHTCEQKLLNNFKPGIQVGICTVDNDEYAQLFNFLGFNHKNIEKYFSFSLPIPACHFIIIVSCEKVGLEQKFLYFLFVEKGNEYYYNRYFNKEKIESCFSYYIEPKINELVKERQRRKDSMARMENSEYHLRK